MQTAAIIIGSLGFVAVALIAMAETSRRDIEEWQDEADGDCFPVTLLSAHWDEV